VVILGTLDEFAADSLLEGDGFEPSVPVKKNPPVETII